MIEAAQARGQLSIVAGRIKIGHATDHKVEVTITRRGSEPSKSEASIASSIAAARATRSMSAWPLHAQMVKDGLLRSDPLDQGLDVSEHEALIGRDGKASRRLFVLGPPTRGRYTEIVAIPDIRLQAADVAERLIAQLRQPSGLAGGPAA